MSETSWVHRKHWNSGSAISTACGFAAGNTFVLRAQLARSGADRVIEMLVRSGVVAYAGYSAGACLATPTLIGLDASDDPR